MINKKQRKSRFCISHWPTVSLYHTHTTLYTLSLSLSSLSWVTSLTLSLCVFRHCFFLLLFLLFRWHTQRCRNARTGQSSSTSAIPTRTRVDSSPDSASPSTSPTAAPSSADPPAVCPTDASPSTSSVSTLLFPFPFFFLFSYYYFFKLTKTKNKNNIDMFEEIPRLFQRLSVGTCDGALFFFLIFLKIINVWG